MKKAKIDEKKRCPKCGKIENQIRVGYNRSGTLRCKCKDCGIRYTIDPKKNAYSDETNVLFWRKWERCWQNFRNEQSKCLQLDKKN